MLFFVCSALLGLNLVVREGNLIKWKGGWLDARCVIPSLLERLASRPPTRPEMMAATKRVKAVQGTCESAISCAHHHFSALGAVVSKLFSRSPLFPRADKEIALQQKWVRLAC